MRRLGTKVLKNLLVGRFRTLLPRFNSVGQPGQMRETSGRASETSSSSENASGMLVTLRSRGVFSTLKPGLVLRAILVAAFLVGGTSIAMAIAGWQLVQAFEQAGADGRLQRGKQALAYRIEENGASLQAWAAGLSNYPALQGEALGRLQGEFDQTARSLLPSLNVDFIALVDQNGKAQVVPPELTTIAKAADFGFRQPRDGSETANQAGFVRANDNSLQWRAVAPIGDPSRPSGYIIVGYLLGKSFGDRFKAANGLDSVIYSETQLVGTTLPMEPGSLAPWPLPDAGTEGREPRKSYSAAFTLGNQTLRVHYFPIQDRFGNPIGTYGLAAPATLTSEQYLSLLLELLSFIVKIIGIAVVATYMITQGVVRPLRTLAGAVTRMSEGDLSTPVELDGKNELGFLAREMEDMRLKLQQTLNALAIETSRYQGIFNSMADGVFTTDLNGRITSSNPAAKSFLQSGGAPLEGQECCAGFSLEGEQGGLLCDRLCLQRTSALGPASHIERAQLRRSDGDTIDVELTVAAVRDEHGSTVGLVHVVRDISAQQELQRMKSRFLLSVAHELRTPLSALSGSVNILREDFDVMATEDKERMLATVQRGSVRLQNLVSNLLDLGSIEAGRFAVRPQPTSIGSSIRESVSLCETLLAPKKQSIEVLLPERLPKVNADGQRISQVLMNLLTNCSKYAPEGDTISLTVSQVKEHIYVMVRDHGPGIEPGEAAHLFEYYYQANQPKSEGTQGFGLGLAIVKGIIDAHGGEVGVESARGSGTTFWFSLPIVEASQAREGWVAAESR